MASEIEERLVEETSDASAEDLGQVDTFRFEDRKIFSAALEALAKGEYQAAHDWAHARMDSFWARKQLPRKLAWQLVQLGASLGLTVRDNEHPTERARSHQDAVEQYTAVGSRVDSAQRKLEQARQQAGVLDIEEFAALRTRLDELRLLYRAWADKQARAFNALCQAEGFLPSPELRQRELFEEVVRPFAQEDGVTAYFVIDGLRYEMGQQLQEMLLAEARTSDVVLKARLAELPTVTEVGMNVLAPVSTSGKLRPDLDEKDILGFRLGNGRVSSPEDRRKVIHERVGGSHCPKLSLEEVLVQDTDELRTSIANARLVFIHSEGIDKAGEKGVGLIVFEQELQNLRAAWRQLYEAGVRRFVFTADHGFLLHDSTSRAPRTHGFKTDPKRRHIISSLPTQRKGEIMVRASELGYDATDACFLFPEDAAPFDLGARAKDFVHGGNSLQERVIPVLIVRHRHAAGVDAARYRLEAETGRALAGMNCLSVLLSLEKDHALSFSSRREVELALECTDDSTVQVELCDAREARVTGNAVAAIVDQRFEIYFRLRGRTEQRVRVRLKAATSIASIQPLEITERFQVERTVGVAQPAPKRPVESERDHSEVGKNAAGTEEAWLLELPEGGVRDLFRHIATHGIINEAEATRLLGGPNKFRRFSRELEQLRRVVPFLVRVDVSSGTKCYVRVEG
jgi:hypothetical protein